MGEEHSVRSGCLSSLEFPVPVGIVKIFLRRALAFAAILAPMTRATQLLALCAAKDAPSWLVRTAHKVRGWPEKVPRSLAGPI